MGFENSDEIHGQNSALIIKNGIKKVRKGVDIFDKRILVLLSSSRTQYFRIRPSLNQSFPCSQQSINWYHSAWCMTHQDSNPRFTELPPLSKVYRVTASIQGLQSYRLYPRFTELPSLSKVYIDTVSIQGLQSYRLYPRFSELPSLSKVYRVTVFFQGLQSSQFLSLTLYL